MQQIFLLKKRVTVQHKHILSWALILHERRSPIKERDKQKHELNHHIHSVKGISNTFESCKANLKNNNTNER